MQVKLASDVFRSPGHGYLTSVGAGQLPWDEATTIVSNATLFRSFTRCHPDDVDAVPVVSPMEIALAAALLWYGIEFDAQYPVGAFDLDFLIDGWLGVEVDGRLFHQDKERDRVRDAIIAREGYTVIRYTGREIYADPLRCAREIDGYRKLGRVAA